LLAADYELLARTSSGRSWETCCGKRDRRRKLDQGMASQLLRDLSRVPMELHPAEPWTEAALELILHHQEARRDQRIEKGL
jgi:hypothetical protein